MKENEMKQILSVYLKPKDDDCISVKSKNSNYIGISKK